MESQNQLLRANVDQMFQKNGLKVKRVKKRIDDYLNKTEKLHTATFSVILLAPIALLFVIYFAMSDIINTAPEWVNDALVAVLGLSAIANFINVAKFYLVM